MCESSLGPGTHSSIRTARLRECVEPLAPPPDLHIDICAQCRPPPVYRASAISEHDRVLREVRRCPLYYMNLDTGGKCSGLNATVNQPVNVTTLLTSQHSTTPPHGLHLFRVSDRIRGIEEIAQLIRGPSASEVTARRRAGIESTARRRHAEHFRAEIPRPPCREVRRGPQPGVPIAPTTPCNLGTQRVDYSNPRA
jgi:hypothetical protein